MNSHQGSGGEAVMSVGFHPSTQPTRSGDRIKLQGYNPSNFAGVAEGKLTVKRQSPAWAEVSVGSLKRSIISRISLAGRVVSSDLE